MQLCRSAPRTTPLCCTTYSRILGDHGAFGIKADWSPEQKLVTMQQSLGKHSNDKARKTQGIQRAC
eukprot:2620343-Amphidinium_carterae.1